MIKEEKNIDFYTTGRELSKEDFTKITEWIKKKKARLVKPVKQLQKQKEPAV